MSGMMPRSDGIRRRASSAGLRQIALYPFFMSILMHTNCGFITMVSCSPSVSLDGPPSTPTATCCGVRYSAKAASVCLATVRSTARRSASPHTIGRTFGVPPGSRGSFLTSGMSSPDDHSM